MTIEQLQRFISRSRRRRWREYWLGTKILAVLTVVTGTCLSIYRGLQTKNLPSAILSSVVLVVLVVLALVAWTLFAIGRAFVRKNELRHEGFNARGHFETVRVDDEQPGDSDP